MFRMQKSYLVANRSAYLKSDQLQSALFQAEKTLGCNGNIFLLPSGESSLRVSLEGEREKDVLRALAIIDHAVDTLKKR